MTGSIDMGCPLFGHASKDGSGDIVCSTKTNMTYLFWRRQNVFDKEQKVSVVLGVNCRT